MTLALFETEPKLPNKLMVRYAEPHRFYHTWGHIEQLLEGFNEIESFISNRDAVAYAIYYHDAIYKIPGPDNEQESADLFADDAARQLDNELIAITVKFIRATKDHQIPEKFSVQEIEDCQHFLDLDMSILGSDPQSYRLYATNIRKEYAQFNDEMYNFGRTKILKEFLGRDQIFLSDHFNKQYEEAARNNISEELCSLGEGTVTS